MAAPTISEMLKYADLQVAAEALYDFNAKRTPTQSPGDPTGSEGHFNRALTADILTDGNLHASRFAPMEAEQFVQHWTVVDHISNTTTGFSGTLFFNSTTGEYVLSFRSTEFIDDVARDCVATNAMEISKFGWAFGQIDDMEAWYAQLKASGQLPADADYSVTGYSLGGHLATAFNLLRREDGSIGNVDRVVTFNGAGVGEVTSGTLASVMNDFKALRKDPGSIAYRFTDPRLGELYHTLRSRLAGGLKPSAEDYALLDAVQANPIATEYQRQRFSTEKNFLRRAMERIDTLKGEVIRLQGVTDSVDGAPARIPDNAIAQESFEYQMAVLGARDGKTNAKALLPSAINTVFGKSVGSPLVENQTPWEQAA